jgi:hypothetical protein
MENSKLPVCRVALVQKVAPIFVSPVFVPSGVSQKCFMGFASGEDGPPE